MKMANAIFFSALAVGATQAIAAEGSFNLTDEQISAFAHIDLSDRQIMQISATGAVELCWNQPVPEGYIVVQYVYSSACGGPPIGKNASVVRLPVGTRDYMCLGRAAPAGWRKVYGSEFRDLGCHQYYGTPPSHFKQAIVIEKL